jgi:PAS domain S-box-containing protein
MLGPFATQGTNNCQSATAESESTVSDSGRSADGLFAAVDRSGTLARIVRGQFVRQLAAAIAVLLALLLRVALERQSIALPTYITFYPVVLFAAVLGGMWAGILATALSALLVDYLLLPPIGRLAIGSTSDIVGMVIFCISGVSASVVAGLYHRSLEKLADYRLQDAVRNERAKAEEERRRTESIRAERQRFFEVLEALPTMISLLTPDHRIAFANRSFRERFGDSYDRCCYEARFSRTEPCEFCQSYRVLATGQSNHWELIFPDGSLFEAYDYPFTDLDGSSLILEMDLDVTERRRAETELEEYREHLELLVAERTVQLQIANAKLEADIRQRELAEQGFEKSRAKLSAALASMTDSVLITDAEGRFVEFNDAFARFYRFRNKGECARDFAEFASLFAVSTATGKPEPREMFATQRALRGETATNVEYTLRRKDTGESWIGSISFSPIRDKDGTITGAVITARDITEAKRAETRLRRFYETDLFAILYWKIDGGVVDVNNKFLEMTGYSREDVRAGLVNWAQITPPEYWALDEDARRQVRETGVHLPYEKEFIRKDGARVWGLFSAAAYEDNRDEGISFILDITEAKRAQEERQITVDFLAMVNQSHGTRDLLQRATAFFQERSGCEAVGIRLREGEDYPYFEARGFSKEFVFLENHICARAASGRVIKDSAGTSVLECLCGNIIRGRVEPSKPFYTAHGSFWSNSTTDLIAIAKEGDLPSSTRHRCNREGYESVGLFPIYVGEERIGLLQLNDRRKGRFSPQSIVLWERLAGHLATAISKFRAEEALRASEEQFRNLANTIPQLCWMANADGERLWHNERWYEYTGATPEQAKGSGWQSAHDPNVLPQVMERLSISIATGSPFDMVIPLRGADGVFRPFLTRIMPVRNIDGQVVRWFGTNTDISEQKQIETELRKSQERLNIALEVAQLGEWERDLKSNSGSRSLRHARIFGYSSTESEWNFETFLSHILPQYRAEVIEWFKSSQAGGIWDFETQIKRADGEIRWVWFRSHTRLDELGQPARAYGVVMDITARKEAEAALLRSEKMALQRQQLHALAERLQQVREEERKKVARDLHDQIGQILTAIKMDMAWVVRHLPRSQGELHDRLTGSMELVNDGVRSVRSICSGLRPGVLDDLGLAAAIEWQANEFASRTGIGCTVCVPPVELQLEGDRATALFRIFQECLTNVARHAEARSVRTSLTEQDGNLLLIVEDDGKGFRESAAGGSLGILGMKERAQVCGGDVQVSSSPGKGTTVTVRVPVHAASAGYEDHAHSSSR